ncbi:MAG: hypothetical protein M1821_002002 [Bathelium mastoideum]|nr:MAG: hypothetical protein M1821_002002 [Bathelium mastoideum]KAI9692508.1 MAG: hypothetical protein M1822_006739 [Bathelium mastoideum]
MSPEPHTSRNQRRLALRNANLRPPLIQRNVTPKSDQPSSTILTEINNASLRRRQQQQRRTINESLTIYEDPLPKGCAAFSDGLSDDKENPNSPECVKLSTPSPVPPVTSHLNVPRTRSPRSPKPRNTSGGYRMHIENLEAQLAAAHGQLEDYSSPKSKKAHSAKRRALSQECELLRKELSDVEERCQHRIDAEAEEYRSCIRRLERELEVSEQRRMEAEYDLDETKKTLRSVQASHIELERRLDSWSELLAKSPTKAAVSTPVGTKPRPKSMFPRISTSNLQGISPPKVLAPSTPAVERKSMSPSREAFSQRPVLPRQPIESQTPCSTMERSPLLNDGSMSIQKRRHIRREELKAETEEGHISNQPLSDELGLLGLGDVFTKHSQTTSSTPSSAAHQDEDYYMDSRSTSPSSPLVYQSDLPTSRAPRVMRRFVNTAGGPRPLALSASLKPEQRIADTPEASPSVFIRFFGSLSRRFREMCSAHFTAARWCLALFLLGPLAWRRVLAGPSMMYGS